MSEIVDHRRRTGTDHRIVIDDKDTETTSVSDPRDRCCRLLLADSSVIGGREPQLNAGADARRAIDLHGAPGLRDKTVDHRQPQASTTLSALGGEEWLGLPEPGHLVPARAGGFERNA